MDLSQVINVSMILSNMWIIKSYVSKVDVLFSLYALNLVAYISLDKALCDKSSKVRIFVL